MSSNGFVVLLVVVLRSRGLFVSRIICGIWDFLLIPICFFFLLVVMSSNSYGSLLFSFYPLVTAAHVLLSGMFLLLVCSKAFRNCFMLVIHGSSFHSLISPGSQETILLLISSFAERAVILVSYPNLVFSCSFPYLYT